MSYIDFICLPLPKGKENEYKNQAKIFGQVMKEHGMLSYLEAVADDVPRGKVTDFYRAVAAQESETVIASYCIWPDKPTRDRAWDLAMKDPRLHSQKAEHAIFDGKRMFWGGFKPLFEIS